MMPCIFIDMQQDTGASTEDISNKILKNADISLPT